MGSNTGLDVVVIGGGAIGVCSAYFLQRAGMRVTLIERSKVAANAPRAPFVDCIDRGQVTSELSRRGKDSLFPLFEDLGYNTRLVSRFCFTSQSTITTSSVRRGTSSNELLLSEMLLDLKSIVNDRGGRIFEGVEVTDLLFSGGRVVGVSTAAGQFVADETVIAAGVLSAKFEKSLGLNLGLREERVVAGDDLVHVPITPIGRPYIGRPEGIVGAILAVGHDVHAISALGVGRVVSDLVAGTEPFVCSELSKCVAAEQIPWAGL